MCLIFISSDKHALQREFVLKEIWPFQCESVALAAPCRHHEAPSSCHLPSSRHGLGQATCSNDASSSSSSPNKATSSDEATHDHPAPYHIIDDHIDHYCTEPRLVRVCEFPSSDGASEHFHVQYDATLWRAQDEWPLFANKRREADKCILRRGGRVAESVQRVGTAWTPIAVRWLNHSRHTSLIT